MKHMYHLKYFNCQCYPIDFEIQKLGVEKQIIVKLEMNK